MNEPAHHELLSMTLIFQETFRAWGFLSWAAAPRRRSIFSPLRKLLSAQHARCHGEVWAARYLLRWAEHRSIELTCELYRAVNGSITQVVPPPGPITEATCAAHRQHPT
jgi:hypothetical protein